MAIVLRGYKGSIHEADVGYFIADMNGRGGKIAGFHPDDNYAEQSVIVEVRTREGSTIELRESEVSFTAPPEMEVM